MPSPLSSSPAPPDPKAPSGIWAVKPPDAWVRSVIKPLTRFGTDAEIATAPVVVISNSTPLLPLLRSFDSFCVRVDRLPGRSLYEKFGGSLVCDEATWEIFNQSTMEEIRHSAWSGEKQPWKMGSLTLIQHTPRKDNNNDNGRGVDSGVRSPRETHSTSTQTDPIPAPQGRNEGSGDITATVPAAPPVHIPAARPLADAGQLVPGPGGGGYSRDHGDGGGDNEGTAGPSRQQQSESDLDARRKGPSPIRVAEAPPLEPDSRGAGRLRAPAVGGLGRGPPVLEVIPGGSDSGLDLDSDSGLGLGVRVLPEGSGGSLDQGLSAVASAKAQEHCRTAMNALEFSDAEKARAEIRAAIALLGGEI